MIRRLVRFTTFLAPAMYPVYEFIARHIGERLGVAVELSVADCYEQLADTDVAFVCGLAWIELCEVGGLPFVPLVAPVLRGSRYADRPIYFSDVIVHRDSPHRSFADLKGATWCFNESLSHSGYGVTRYHLTRLGQTRGFFGRVIESGFHQRSIRLVRTGEVDASAIDSHVLALSLLADPHLERDLRVIDSLGPSTIQPVVAATWLPEDVRDGIREVLLEMPADPLARTWLSRGLIDRFVPVDADSYDDVRRMRQACIDADFLTLR